MKIKRCISKNDINSVYSELPLIVRLKQRYREHICPFAPILDVFPDGELSLLDVGCGAGAFGLAALSTCDVSKYVGIDIDSRSTEYAKLAIEKALHFNFISEGKDIKFANDVLDVKGEQFDVIVIIDVLHHVKKNGLKNFLSQIIPLLKDSGYLIVKDMDTQNFKNMVMNQMHDLLLAREWIEHIPPKVLDKTVVDGLAMSLTDSKEYDSMWYSHYLKVYRIKS